MEFYRDSFPHATVLPKMHDGGPFLRKWRVGLGFLGEQGAESIHRRFNTIKGNYTSMPNSVQRLESTMVEHYRQIAPQNIVKQPEAKHYKTHK